MTKLRFRANPEKALEVLTWLASARPGLTFLQIVKIIYFADKLHLQRYGRPITGDRYMAMEHGPVPSLIYDLLGENHYLDPALIDATRQAIEVRERFHVYPQRQPDLELLSGSDLRCLAEALETYGALPVKELIRRGHEERAWVEANLNSEMDYELMIDPDVPDREALIESLHETARYVAL